MGTGPVSACLIVKNEEHHLPDCLPSLRSLVDQVVVVDTGSTDCSVDIARSFECDVVQHAWAEDFSEARNVALDHAVGDWILYIDADERVVTPKTGKLNDHLPGEEAVAARLLLQPRVGFTVYSELRLFRNDPRIRFRGVMHERVTETVREVCATDQKHVAEAHEIRIDHIGYEGDQSHKHARNEPLLRKALLQNPDRLYCWFHLAETLRATGQEHEADECLGRALSLATASTDLEELSVGSSCCQIRAEALFKSGDFEAGLQWADRGLAMCADNYGLVWMRARALLELGRCDEAIEEVLPLSRIDHTGLVHRTHSFDQALFTLEAPGLLGSAYFELGRYEVAEQFFSRAADAIPSDRRQIEFKVKAQLARSMIMDFKS